MTDRTRRLMIHGKSIRVLLTLGVALTIQNPWSGQAFGQEPAALHARELFYTPPPGASVVKPAAEAVVPVVSRPEARPAVVAPPPPPKRIAKKINNPVPTTPANSVQPAAEPEPSPIVEAAAGRPAPVEAVPLGLRYSVMKRDGSGKFEEVDKDSIFHSGDRIRLEAEANTTGYLYVVAQGSSGNWQLLFPSREVAGGSNQVHRGEARQIPAGGSGQFLFDEQAGEEKLFVVLSRQPEANLDKLIYQIGTPATPTAVEPARVLMAQTTVSDDVISRIRGELASRDLVFEKVDNEKVSQNTQPRPQESRPNNNNGQVRIETAAYVVNPSVAPDARLIVDLILKHQ